MVLGPKLRRRAPAGGGGEAVGERQPRGVRIRVGGDRPCSHVEVERIDGRDNAAGGAEAVAPRLEVLPIPGCRVVVVVEEDELRNSHRARLSSFFVFLPSFCPSYPHKHTHRHRHTDTDTDTHKHTQTHTHTHTRGRCATHRVTFPRSLPSVLGARNDWRKVESAWKPSSRSRLRVPRGSPPRPWRTGKGRGGREREREREREGGREGERECVCVHVCVHGKVKQDVGNNT